MLSVLFYSPEELASHEMILPKIFQATGGQSWSMFSWAIDTDLPQGCQVLKRPFSQTLMILRPNECPLGQICGKIYNALILTSEHLYIHEYLDFCLNYVKIKFLPQLSGPQCPLSKFTCKILHASLILPKVLLNIGKNNMSWSCQFKKKSSQFG